MDDEPKSPTESLAQARVDKTAALADEQEPKPKRRKPVKRASATRTLTKAAKKAVKVVKAKVVRRASKPKRAVRKTTVKKAKRGRR